jgi:hypothetical protein
VEVRSIVAVDYKTVNSEPLISNSTAILSGINHVTQTTQIKSRLVQLQELKTMIVSITLVMQFACRDLAL